MLKNQIKGTDQHTFVKQKTGMDDDGDESKKKINDIMRNLALNMKAETETIKKIKQAPVENSSFKNLMKILNNI